jgi:hypothetical protein
MRSLKLLTLMACALVLLPMAAPAATTSFVAGEGYASATAAEATTADFYTGSGSWYKNYGTDNTAVEVYIDPATQFGTTFTIDDIADIRYWTKNDGTNPSGVDFFMKIYTVPDGVDDDATWYGRRLNAEPYLSNNYTPVANTWVQWSAASSLQNQLTWFDYNNCGNYGFYGEPTLGVLQAGPVTWTDYANAAPTANPNPIDYGPETVLYFTIGTGSGWASFEGYLDAVEFELTNGDTYVFDLEGPADPIYVDDDWAGLPVATEVEPGRWLGYNAYDTVQNGVNFASTQVFVAEGTYQEQVVIDKDLEVIGAGIGLSTILSPAALDVQFSTSKDYKPVVTATGANVTLRGFTVDGDGQGNANVYFLGVAYHNAGGNLTDCEVIGIRNEPLDGGQHGVALYGLHDDGGTYAVNCRDNLVYDFQKNAMAWNSINGSVVTLEVTGNTVTGAPGLTADNGDPAQNGIQVLGAGTTALIDGNTVSGIGYDNTNASTPWVATSLLLYYGDMTVSNNDILAAQTAGYMIEGQVTFDSNVVEVQKYGLSGYGLIVADPPAAVPQPFDQFEGAGVASRRAGVLNNVVSGNTLTFSGVDNAGTIAIEADAGYYDFLGDGPETQIVSVVDNVVSGFDYAVAILECATGCTGSDYTSVDIHDNDLGGNNYGLYTDAFSAVVDASCNWWGDTSGPTAVDNVLGTGAVVEGDAVYEPWLDGPTGACVLSSDYVSVGPPPSEIAGCTSCIQVPVTLFRSDTSAARGVSVTFQLSPELELCGAPAVSYGPGTFYDGYVDLVVAPLIDNGGGSYTFDTAVQGLPCGPTVGGEVFTIPVTYASSVTGDATGTITITDVTLRDCSNAPLPALPGPGTTIDIDLTAPGAVTNLVATQRLAGNGLDDTTIIDLSWDLPADADVTSIEVYRKGFGFYPEYDDDGGSVPATPIDPADAIANGWQLAATLAPGATELPDEPAVRDFWYYVVFVNDECYTSVVSDQTGGSLNYHLGDIVPGAGNNTVGTGDISALGAAYGTFAGDQFYNANADVGPTTDFSVIALPTTDNQIQFEDLIVFAINYGQVSRPATQELAAFNEIEIVSPSTLVEGERVSVPIRMAADGTLQGVSVAVDWNGDVLEYAGYSAGDLMVRNDAPVLSPEPGVIDAAALGVSGHGLGGEGVMATLHFKVRSAGDPGLVIAEIDARNSKNEQVTLDGRVIGDTPSSEVVIRRSALRPNVPNPFNPRTTVYFDLAQAGRVSVRVYSVSGRLVRTLVSEDMSAGNHAVVWDGIDDTGRSVASGAYLVQLVAKDRTDSRSMVLLK